MVKIVTRGTSVKQTFTVTQMMSFGLKRFDCYCVVLAAVVVTVTATARAAAVIQVECHWYTRQ